MTRVFDDMAAERDPRYTAEWIPWHSLEVAFDYDRFAAWYIKERDMALAWLQQEVKPGND